MQEIHRGAEAVIYRDDDSIVKKRLKKGYRLDILDESLTSGRTKAEAKILEKLNSAGVKVPKLIETDNASTIRIEYIDGQPLSQYLNKNNYEELMEKVGKILGEIHDLNISHGDLTTSNIMHKDNEIYMIDFGLSFHSERIEDKAVDIHLLKESLEAKHFDFHKGAFESFCNGYKNSESFEDVMERLEAVEKRGRYKSK